MRDKAISLRRWISYWVILLVVVPVMLLALAEVCARAVVWARYGVPGKQYGLWDFDPKLGAVHAKHAYNSNSETNDFGFRNREDVIEPKPSGAFRIIAYGGSTTFCYNL